MSEDIAIKTDTESRLTLTESIRARQAEIVYLTHVLDLWAKAGAQGVDSSEGGSFGFDSRLLTPRQRIAWNHKRGDFIERDSSGISRPKLFNYFRYPDGRIVILFPMLEAVYRD